MNGGGQCIVAVVFGWAIVEGMRVKRMERSVASAMEVVVFIEDGIRRRL